MTKITIPQQIPARREFVKEMLAAVFPDSPDVPKTQYYNLCDKAVLEFEEDSSQYDGKLFRLMYELDQYIKHSFSTTGRPSKDISIFKNFMRDECGRFCERDNGVLDGWLTSPTGTTTLYYPTAAFFGYLLLTRQSCTDTRKAFLYRCLALLGITEVTEPIRSILSDFNLKDLQQKETFFYGEAFHRLKNPASLTLVFALVTILRIMGHTCESEREQQKVQEAIVSFQRFFCSQFEQEEQLSAALQAAEERLWECTQYFEPRTIPASSTRLHPQNFFVVPSFHNGQDEEVNPSSLLCHDEHSRRCLIVGNTGQGKSLYIQLCIFCMLYRRYNTDKRDEDSKKVDAIRQSLDVTEDKYILCIPARMFSSCYLREDYKSWTEDFVTLYFNCMWQFPEENFFSQPNQMSRLTRSSSASPNTYEVSPLLKKHLQALARSGRLILLLDSYDEIVSGDMRLAYENTLNRFYTEYGSCFRSDEVGAHILLSTRRMSPDTMQRLCSKLCISEQNSLFYIQPLNMANIRQLVYNWSNGYYRHSSGDTERLIAEIETNHYCRHYAVNPYTLSVICKDIDRGFDEIMRNYVRTLLELLHNKTRQEPIEIHGVLNNIQNILEDIAGDMVIHHQSSFSRHRLESYLRQQLTEEFSDESDKIESHIERLHEIFATVIGLIVPADGSDEDYQFINEQIRFELAAKHFKRLIARQPSSQLNLSILPTDDVSEYVGYMVPLICSIKDDYPLAEQLVYHLSLYNCTPSEAPKLLTAILDLLLNRYSSSIATLASPGTNVEPYIRRSQLLLLMRVMTAECFVMTDSEKEAFRQCNAYRANRFWFGGVPPQRSASAVSGVPPQSTPLPLHETC